MIYLKAAQGLLLLPVLIHASAEDIRHHECADVHWWILLVLSAISLFTVGPLSMFLGGVSAFLPLLAAALIHPGCIGGADIKMAGAFGLILGMGGAVPGLLLGLLLSVLTMAVIRKIQKKDRKEPFALVPFLSAGFMTSFVIGCL